MMKFESIDRAFQLKFPSQFLTSSATWKVLGFHSEANQDWESCLYQVTRAERGEYDTIVLPSAILDTLGWSDLKKRLELSDRKILLAIENDFSDEENIASKMSGFHRWAFLRIFDFSREEAVFKTPKPGEFIWIIGGKLTLKHIENIQSIYVPDKTFFYFPYSFVDESLFLDTNELYEVNKILQNKLMGGTLRLLPGVDIFDPRADLMRETDPCYECETIASAIDGEQILISVIIPTYNNKVYLGNVIRHLCMQNLGPEFYEVIIVDDGSTDETKTYILNHLPPQRNINLRYIYFPRARERSMGDGQFRAGIARNLGVQYAKGDIIAFLDSDVLVPVYYLSTICDEHREADVTQARRVELKKELSSGQVSYQDIHLWEDTYINDPAYWHDFLYGSRPWSFWNDGWKFTCTHSLTVKRDILKNIGWFRTAFLYYGYEDTDLGHRFWKAKCSFKLLDIMVYHLHHADTRSEYDNSQAKKMALLSKSAEIFYRNTLDNDVYGHCSYHFQMPLIRLVRVSRFFFHVSKIACYLKYKIPIQIWGEQVWHRYIGHMDRLKNTITFMISKTFWSSVGLISKPVKRVIRSLYRG